MARTKRDYEVGYKKPPRGTQFKSGQSGNPKGRPKGSKAFPTLVLEELKAWIAVTEGGITKRMSKAQAIVKQLISRAIKGDLRATALINALVRVATANQPAADTPLSPEEQEILNAIYGQQPRRRNGTRRRK
jgi:Family of unknown function (DUF5681)